MQVVETKPLKPDSKLGGFFKTAGLIIFILVLNIPALLIVLGSLGGSSVALISPLPEGERTASANPPPAPAPQSASGGATPLIAAPAAAPQSASGGATATGADTNSRQGTATILAGQQTTTVLDPIVTADSYIYLVPKTPTAVFLKSKDIGAFTVEAVASPAADLVLDYWIVNR